MTRGYRLIIIGILMAELLLWGCASSAPSHAKPRWTVKHGRCFSLDDWSAWDGRRPCVQVDRVYEDGSFKVTVLDASGVKRYDRSVGVPNAYEGKN